MSDDKKISNQRQQQPIAPERVLLWYKRTCWVLVSSIVLTLLLSWFGYSPFWVAIIASITFAEITRRIMAESNPETPSRWIDILRFAWNADNAKATEYTDTDSER